MYFDGKAEHDMNDMKEYLRSTEVIDYDNPDVLAKAKELAIGVDDPLAIAKRCFEWVRDQIQHSMDYKINPVTCNASEVLREGTGFCYAKSHLLAALLRANTIPTGFCYQRLTLENDQPSFCLHGLNAVYLPETGWYRIDPRGNKDGVDAQFSPPVENLAFKPHLDGEADLSEVWADPLPQIIKALRTYHTYDELSENFPDIEIVAGGISEIPGRRKQNG
jgi:transglutaminase-like putative cysteine protease